MKPGTYNTNAGSIVEISGKHGGLQFIRLDWVEEENCCIECSPSINRSSETLEWSCDDHRGSANLNLVSILTIGK